MIHSLAAILLGAAPAPPPLVPPLRCSVVELRYAPSHQYSVERIGHFVDSADVIVRAVAEAPEPGADNDGTVTFSVVEWIRGSGTGSSVRFAGRLVDRDDFNPRAVPYAMVRSGGQRGDCFAREYRAGAEYLLILRRMGDELTPYWQALAPLNEQVRGAADPWVAWVRARVEVPEV